MQTRSQNEKSRASIAPQLSPPSLGWRYYVCLRDHGKFGREAVVDPQHTASNITDLIATGEWPADSIIFIHAIQDGICADVTEEILVGAQAIREIECNYARSDFAEHNTLNHAQQGVG